MGILDGVKRGADRMQNDLRMLNRKRNDRHARGLGFVNADELKRVKRKERANAINESNKKKREAEIRRIRKEATLTRREKIQRVASRIESGSKKVRSEINSFERMKNDMALKPSKKKDPDDPYGLKGRFF